MNFTKLIFLAALYLVSNCVIFGSGELFLDQLSKDERNLILKGKHHGRKALSLSSSQDLKSSNSKRKKYYNPNLIISRNDPRIATVHMSPDDTIDTKICFGHPIRIFLADENDQVMMAGVSEKKIFFDASVSEDKKSVVVMLKKELKPNEIWPGYVSIQRKDGKSYNINLIANACPLEEKMGLYPQEIRIHPLDKTSRLNSPFLNSEQFIAELTKAYPRRHIHQVKIGLLRAHSNYTKIHIPFTLILQDDPFREKWNFEVHFIDSLQVQKFKSTTEFLKYSSLKKSRINHSLTFDFNSKVSVSKKYIKEREFVYIVIIDKDKKVYFQGKINLRSQIERLKGLGYELN